MILNKPGIRIVYTTPDGNSLDLHNPPERTVINHSGLGLSDREVSTVQRVFQVGRTALSQNLVPRQIDLTLRYNGYGRNDFLDKRVQVINFFRENRSALSQMELGTLTFYYHHNKVYTQRAIDVYLQTGGLLDPPRAGVWDQYAINDTFSFIAPYPIFYDPAYTTVTPSMLEHLVLGTGLERYEFPFILGAYKSAVSTITYTGTWAALPVIELNGSVSNVTIRNVTTDTRLDFAGSVGSGDTVTITITPDEILCVDSSGNSRLSDLYGDLNLFTIESDPLATGGSNVVNVYAETVDGGTINIKYHNWYRGI